MKIFKNRFFIIFLSIALFFSILGATLSIMGVKNPIKNILNTVTLPIRYVGEKIGESYEGFKSYFASIDKIREENSSLKEEIESLETLLTDAQAAKDENARLRDYIDIKKNYPELKMADALIVGRESENYATFFTLDCGENDGIKVGMAVIVKEGIVGSICETGNNWSRVRIITEASASVGAYVQRSGEIGLVCGDISKKDTGACILKYLPENADVEVGDLVYTSGEGSVYPKGLFIGKISKVETDNYLRSKVAEIECEVDFDSLKHVIIVVGLENGEEG